MAKILLINPVVREEDVPKHIPYGLSLLAAIAIEKGHQVQFYDENAWRKGETVIRQVLAADDWDVIGIGGLITTYGSIKRILKLCKEIAPKSFLVAGGGFFTSMPTEMMNWLPQIDLGVIGEAFLTWPEILKKIDDKDFDFNSTLGVCYRDKVGNPKLNAVRPNIHNLDILPYPAWDLLPMEIYLKNTQLLYSEDSFSAKKRIDINGSFGCSLICRYCWHLGTTGDMVVEKNPDSGDNEVRFSYGRNIRYHSPEYIVRMVKALIEKYQIDFASFIDENMMTMHVSSGYKWLYALSDAWIKGGLQPTCVRDGVPHDENCRGVHWSGTSHAGLVDANVLKAMRKAGCSHLVYGLESFDPIILKKLGKGSNQQSNIDCIKMTLDAGIVPLPNIIIGFPEENFQSVRNTMEWMIKLGIYAKPHFATPYPGSEWYYTYKDSIIEQYKGDLEKFIEELADAAKITAVISHKFSGMQLLGLQQIVASRDLRLLEQAERHWGESDLYIHPLVKSKESFNVVKKKIKAPVIEVAEI